MTFNYGVHMNNLVPVLLAIVLMTACVSTHERVLGTQNSQVQTRNYQSRAFETNDRDMVLRSIISTMQDLGFIINKADQTLGTISGTSFSTNSRLTVSVRQMGQNRIVVRANAQAGLKEIADPMPYQNFFNALAQSLFLEAHLID
jgi:hypothetical protein